MAYIKNKTETMTAIFEKRKNFVIPQYQRKFEWEDSNFISLIQELKSDSNDSKAFIQKISKVPNPVIHDLDDDPIFRKSQIFLGNLVLHGNNVVDGQQRLTSLMVISKGIFDYMESKELLWNERPFLRALKTYLTPTTGGIHVPFIKSEVVGQVGVNEAILGLSDKKIGNLKTKKLLNKVVAILSDKKEKVTIDTLELMAFKILSIQFIILEIDTIEDAFDIFEKLNSKSTPLQPADLIKNKVLSCAQKIDKFKKYAEDFKVVDTNLSNLDPTTFFRMSVMIRRAKTFEEKDIEDIYTRKRTLYNDIFTNISNDEVLDIFDYISELSVIYSSYFVSRSGIKDGHKNLSSRFINTKKSQILSTITLYLSELHSTNDITYKTYIESVIWLENFFLRMFTLENNPAKEVDKIIPKVIFKIHNSDVKDLETIKDIFKKNFIGELELSDDKIYEKISTKQFTNDTARHIVLKLWDETLFNEEKNTYEKDTYDGVIETIKDYEVHLEHLLPQQPTNWIDENNSEWSNYEISGANSKVSKDDAIYKYIYSIGNLFIVKDSDNLSAGNAIFKEKIQTITNDKIFMETTFMDIPEHWNPNDIDVRAEKIASIYKENNLLSID